VTSCFIKFGPAAEATLSATLRTTLRATLQATLYATKMIMVEAVAHDGQSDADTAGVGRGRLANGAGLGTTG
jgi:hypothetical protein